MASSNRPGVEIKQELSQSASTPSAPALVPVVVGVCRQIVEALDSDGALDSDAKYADARYNQASMYIPQADFPDPRENIDELEIDESTIEVSLYFGGSLRSLDRGSNDTYGSAFLKLMNECRAAALRTSEAGDYAFDATVGDAFTFAFDVVNAENVSSDITVTFVGTLTATEVAEQINEAVGSEVATVTDDDRVQLTSPTLGATSSITVRAGTSALPVLFGATFPSSVEYRVVGAGFHGQDDEDGDLYTPWIEFSRGGYFEDDVEQASFDASPSANVLWAGQVDIDGEFVEAKAAAVTYTGTSATVPLVAATASVPGDQMWADGSQVGSGEVIKVEQSRFKIGKLNNSLSTFDDDGEPTNRVYDTVEVNTESHGTPFAPKYVYFRAQGLEYGSITPEGEAATLTGTSQGLAERSAYVQSSEAISFPLSPASLTLIFAVTEDGVAGDEVTYTFAGGPYADAAALVALLSGEDEFDQLTISAVGDRLVLATTKTGADQAITVKSTGTANTALKFSATDATSDSGKDVEFAEQAEIVGSVISLPISWLDGLTAEIIVTDSKGTHTISAVLDATAAAAATISALADALNDALGSDGGIPVVEFSGPATAYGSLTVTTVEGGADVSVAITATDGTDAFSFLGFYDATRDEPAEVTSNVAVYPLALDGAGLIVAYEPGVISLSDLLGAAEAAATSAAALAALLNARDLLTSSGTRLVQYIGTSDDRIKIRSVAGGAAVSIDVDEASAAAVLIGFDAATDFDSGVASSGNADAEGADLLKSTTLVFNLDDNPYDYSVTFSTNSLQDAIDEINELVDGSDDVAAEDSRALVLTSLLAGAASKVYINETDSSADTVLGLSGDDEGSGRPNPDFYLDGDGAVHIGPNILRNKSSGIPFSLASALADVYVAYTALRKDVTSSAADPALLTFDDSSTMEAAIGPISTDNPLALGVFLAMANCPSNSVSAIGVDEDSSAAPYGTLDGWMRAMEYLESKEVYTIAPLTDDEYVQGLLAVHTTSMSAPEERGERILFIWSPLPDRAATITVASGNDAESNGTDNSITLDTNPNSELIANGIDPSDEIEVDANLYLEIVITNAGSSELRRYSVQEVNGVVLTLRTAFEDGENDDGFFTTETLDEEVDGGDWALKIRGDRLYVTGTEIADLGAEASAAAAQATPYAHRRVYYLACDSVDVSIDGVTQNVEGFYAAAAIAGMIAEQPPQQPFTNFPIAGLGAVYGTDDTYSENQLDTIADGGRYLLVNLGGAVSARKQLSTDTTSIENKELSITKAIDWLAKGLRSTNRVFIGRSVITSGFLDQLTLCNEGFLDYAEQLGVVRKAELKSLLQDSDEPDTVLIEVEVAPVYPCNKIKITIVS